MPSELQSLDTIFNSRVFRIPDYQRGYSWATVHLEAFWDDLNRLRELRSHYTGQLTFEKVPDLAWKKWDEDTLLIEVKGYKPFYVVDGQQRLTTAIILVKCLLECVPTDGQLALTDKADLIKKYLVQQAGVSRAYLFGYERDNPSYEYLKTQIIGEPSNQFQGTETSYTANLKNAQEFFRKKIKDATPETIERWFKSVTQRFVFNVYELEQELDVFVVFETMNNRGKALSRLELLKNRLIYLSTLIPEPTEEEDRKALRRNVNDAWKTIFEFLGREKDRILDDDDFLRAHWIMYFIYKRDDAGQFSSFLLGEHFTTARVTDKKLHVKELQRYVTSIQDSVRKWHEIHFSDRAQNLGAEVRRSLERMDRVGRGAFEPIMMAAMQKASGDAQLTNFLTASERFVFTVGRLSRSRADTGDSEFYRLAGELYRGERTLPEATDIVTSRTTKNFSAEKAIGRMRELFQDSNGFYSWDGLRYFLFEYEHHLKDKAGMGTIKLTWNEFNSSKRDHATIEHIYPNVAASADWPSFEVRSETERRVLRNSLGNLVAASQSRNSKFSNRPFAAKKQDADGAKGYFNGSYSEIEVAQLADWTPQSILNRGLAMLDFLESRWHVSLGTHDDKVKFLNLEFLLA
ncbi:MAG TPA: DUF262 domain-containing protein [Bryobacteraceae bacterium]|jgi:uncharacterized protein with ParB-like and HNH nuclease domain|nr:DUF262 domain-containing protein [Bryobacteraceae bacterium]